MNKVELLVPAGDLECFYAGITYGDAVYLSGEKYGARAYAKNFSEEDLIKAINYAHLLNKKVHLTVNTVIKENEFSELYSFLLPFYKVGLDAVIVQDLGAVSYLSKVFPSMEIHGSTQMAVTSVEGLKFLERYNVKRVVPARELSLDEIKDMINNSNMDIECFIHGALCYSYSGKCFFSSMIGDRSGNRGRCAGSCRQPYNNKYPLSTKDICTLGIIPDLINAGIKSFKIEGRMKSPDYVKGVSKIYRKYIDLYYEGINKKLTLEEIKNKYFKGKEFDNDKKTLVNLYTRGGNSEGYYYKHNGSEMITISDASYKSAKENIAEEKTKDYPVKVNINAEAYLYNNNPVKLVFSYKDLKAEVSGDIVETANGQPVNEENIIKQIKKTGNTPFEIGNIKLNLDDNVFVRVSSINQLRREGIEKLFNLINEKYYRNDECFIEKRETVTSLFKSINSAKEALYKDTLKSVNANEINDSITDNRTNINFYVNTLEQLKACISNNVSTVTVPFKIIKDQGMEKVLSLCNDALSLRVSFPYVIRHDFFNKNKEIINELIKNVNHVYADNFETVYYLRNNGFNGIITADMHLYVLNNEAVAAYLNCGISNTTVPVELNKKEILRRNLQGEELIVYGYIPMMISAQCVNKTVNGCDKESKNISLKDRTNSIFTAVNNCQECSNIIYNSVPLSLHGEGELVNKIKPADLRVMLTIESDKEINSIINYYKDLSFLNDKKGVLNKFTKGHLNRGVL